MGPNAAKTLPHRLRRFVRWFFTASPEAAAELRPSLQLKRAGAKARRPDSACLRAQNAGRVRIADRERA